MLPRSLPVDATPVPLGQHRGISDLARIASDLTWAPKRVEFDDSARSRAYPSPPMSGSPPLPTKPFQGAGERGQAPGGYPTGNSQDGYRGTPNQQSPIDPRGPPNAPPSLPSLFRQEQQEAMLYPPEETLARPGPYVQPGVPGMPQQPGYLPAAGPSAPGPYPVPSRPLVAENQQMTSPKSQRKTKGHVASACVPCKRTHLRCDAQRPCSRCITNGKDYSCVDMQHKKRGRPRRRDDRDTRYDPSQFPHPQDAAARRPLSIYPSGGGAMGSGEPMPPRYLERAPAADANSYAVPSSIAARVPEPVAFLNMKMEFAKVSPVFADAIGGANIQGRSLGDIVVPAERERVLAIRSQLLEEQTRKEPNYLPPILARLDHIIQGPGFSAEEVGRFQLERQEYLTFRTFDGQARQYLVRLGLAKEGSIYFVVMMLSHAARHFYPQAPSPFFAQGYNPQPQNPQAAYGQRAPVSATFDPARQRFNEGPLGSRPPPGPSGQLPPNPTPGMGAGAPSYAASPSRQEYPGPTSYHIPRSELTTTIRPRPQPLFQLSPIRAPQDQAEHPGERTWSREERPGRVDIGGLIRSQVRQDDYDSPAIVRFLGSVQ
ncbi:hypothetical protein BGZ61DRAFT_486536 [Ilyonectria robusta]|uniref:uncharacterized protein n=1 Tax=Ilyonectria robusta TaxID=1079257 RepID=UPI001E8CC485|nr:uncharacterized protein BGZ61DRAFT_486536 [Ilyonectria robusta]KAH8656764.1 hypothetical protein BGZ61DRAFT_486536 [Ilyonectria robusta]